MPVAEKAEDQAVHPTIFMEPYRVPTLSIRVHPNWKQQLEATSNAPIEISFLFRPLSGSSRSEPALAPVVAFSYLLRRDKLDGSES